MLAGTVTGGSGAPAITWVTSTAASDGGSISGETWTIRKVLTWTTQHFEKRQVDAPRLTAEILLGHVLKTSRVRLYVDLDRPLAKEELASFRALIERRMTMVDLYRFGEAQISAFAPKVSVVRDPAIELRKSRIQFFSR